jgi:two-component system chemotaxis response regulator CheY
MKEMISFDQCNYLLQYKERRTIMDRETRTILLVDNSASMLFYISMLLKRLEYRVATAQSAEDALRTMDGALPSIVVTETSLPGMSGIDLLKRIKGSPRMKNVPVVMLTSQSDAGLKETCEGVGCAGFLYKPVEPDLLYRRLQAVSESIPRANIRVATALTVIMTEGAGVSRTEIATEISEGGLFIRTPDPRPKDALLQVRIVLPAREISAAAVVLYSFKAAAGTSKVPGMGMKFVEISDPDRETIRRFIKEKLVGDIAPQGA